MSSFHRTGLLLCALFSTRAALAQTAVNFTVNTTTGRYTISPLIYGTNEPLQDSDNYRSVRMGGNRLTGYNWENNASHAGEDFNHQNDSYLCAGLSATDCNLPGRAVSQFYTTAKSKNQAALVTLQLAGYVAADKSGTTVTTAQVAPSSRWKQVVFRKGSAFSLSPDLSDNSVYMDEQVNYLVQQHGTTANGGVAGYFLDNEPGLWPSTHPRLHPAQPTAQEIWTRSRDLALAVKDVDASAQIYGGVLYGFSDYFSLQAAPDYNAEVVNGGYAWFVDYYLDKMRQASQTAGRRLLDVLDVHWYPEAVGTSRITNGSANTATDQAARLQAPRTLWQPGYHENSWIANEPYFLNNYLPILPRLLQSINTYYPGTKLSISEYAYGGNDDITGGLAQADVLGIFGRYGVHNANWWKLYDQSNPTSTAAFISPAFRLYTNYDGAGSAFGDTGVPATTTDVPNTSLYAAIQGTDERRLTLVVLNKSTQPITGSFTLTSGVSYATARAWQLTAATASLVSKPNFTLTGNQFTYTLPARSATAIELRTPTPLPIQLTAFTAQATDAGTALSWATAAEHNADYFELQRRGEWEAEFHSLGHVPATNSSRPRSYQLLDNNPLPGLSYYRLQLVDRDGTRSAGPVQAVHTYRTAPLTLRVYPTAVTTGVLHYELSPTLAETLGNSQLEVLTLTGQRVATARLDGGPHGQIEVAHLQPGSYLVQLSSPAGKFSSRFAVL